MKKFSILIICIFFVGCGAVNSVLAPAKKKNKDDGTPNLELADDKPDADTIPDVEPKVKKNVYYGVKTKKGFTRNENRTQVIFELFNYLKEPTRVDNYVRQVYYHDMDRNRVVATVGRGQVMNRVLHGPYKKTINDITVEEGMYFYGTKHETWFYQRTDSTLADKAHFHKGWFRDSEITYYDEVEKKKIKEVIPMRYGKKEGFYYRFFENGNIAVTGRYVFDKKVEVWSEYHNLGEVVRVKKEIQYPGQFYLKDFKPYVRREWDRNAQLIYTAPELNQ